MTQVHPVIETNDARPRAGIDHVLWMNASTVKLVFDRELALSSQRDAFAALGSGTARTPRKISTLNPDGSSVALTYTAQLSSDAGPVTKFTAIHPLNATRGLPTISAVVLALDATTGRLVGVLDGTTITTKRTAAASALAIETLATADADVLTLFGYGVQAREHAYAIAATRALRELRVVGRRHSESIALATELTQTLGVLTRVFADVEAAVRGSSIIVTCTTSRAPLFSADWVDQGALIVSIGSFEPDRHEVGQDVIARADLIVVDEVSTALEHAGPVILAIENGTIDRSELLGLSECLAGAGRGRQSDDEVVFYNTTGLGIQDAAAAGAIIERAESRGLGIRLEGLEH